METKKLWLRPPMKIPEHGGAKTLRITFEKGLGKIEMGCWT